MNQSTLRIPHSAFRIGKVPVWQGPHVTRRSSLVTALCRFGGSPQGVFIRIHSWLKTSFLSLLVIAGHVWSRLVIFSPV
jgi:hypothetical protein